MTAVRAMLFDLDGTLLDSAPDLVVALNFVRDTAGLEPLSVELVGHAVTRGAPGLLKVGMPETDDETFETWRQMLLGHYASSGFPESKLYDGISELLEALDSAGIPWGIVTNKIESLTHAFIEMNGLGGRISSIVCGDTVEKTKPHPEPVLLACEQMGVPPEETLFVGDDLRDLEAGEAAGTQTAAVFYGYGSGGLAGPLVEKSIPVHHPADLLCLVG